MNDYAPACDDAIRLITSDGCNIALHDLGGTGEPILLSHATGFNAHVWQAVADVLAPRFHSYALDYRGYGDSDANDPGSLNWIQFGHDAVSAAEYVVGLNAGKPIAAAGHSMGGAALFSAHKLAPHLFKALFVYEPIITPQRLLADLEPTSAGSEVKHRGNHLADGARRRRQTFDSLDAALSNFASKPPMKSFAAAAREGYIRNGFRQNPDGSVSLKCLPEYEARTYETGGSDPQWSDLARINVPVWVIAGMVEPGTPARIAHFVAEEIPGATYVEWADQGHFGPLEHPETFAGFVGRTVATLPS